MHQRFNIAQNLAKLQVKIENVGRERIENFRIRQIVGINSFERKKIAFRLRFSQVGRTRGLEILTGDLFDCSIKFSERIGERRRRRAEFFFDD